MLLAVGSWRGAGVGEGGGVGAAGDGEGGRAAGRGAGVVQAASSKADASQAADQLMKGGRRMREHLMLAQARVGASRWPRGA